jgi:hypothetical protein
MGTVYSTFLGGSEHDEVQGLAVDTEGNLYLTGYTSSPDFPTTEGAFQRHSRGYADAFIVKMSADGKTIHYATLLGGWNGDQAHAIAVDGQGHAYIVGDTYSDDFPTTERAFDRDFDAGLDIFIAKLSTDGSRLLYSTLLGGTCYDQGYAIALDQLGRQSGQGYVYVTGSTCSADFPTTENALDRSYNGHGAALLSGGDAFITKLAPDGTTLTYSTFLGGSEDDYGIGIALDQAGNAYITGATESVDFRTTASAFDRDYGGGTCGVPPNTHPCADAFIAQLNITPVDDTDPKLNYATFIGDRGFDEGTAIALDTAGNLYVAGETAAPQFPTTEGALDVELHGQLDAFVIKLRPEKQGTRDLRYSTLLGGNQAERATAIAIDRLGNIYVTGFTTSIDFPTTWKAFDTAYKGPSDAFVLKLNPGGNNQRDLLYSTLLGGQSQDSGKALGLSTSGDAYIAGRTASADFPTTRYASILDSTCGTDGRCNTGGSGPVPPSPYPFPLKEGGQLDPGTRNYKPDAFITKMALANVLPLHALAPVITEPMNAGGYARAVDFHCAIGGQALPGATVTVYQRMKTDPQFPSKHLDDALQRYGLKVGEARVEEIGNWRAIDAWRTKGEWRVEDLYLRLGGNIFTAIAHIQGQIAAPSESVFIQMLPIADIYVGDQSSKAREAAQFINSQFWQAQADTKYPYESHVHVLPIADPADIVHNLSRDWIFHFSGYVTRPWHSDATSLNVPTSLGTPMTITADHIRQRPLCQLQLAVLAAPGSGDHPQADASVLRAFWEQGARTVIGFHGDVSPSDLAQWNLNFWNLALNSHTRPLALSRPLMLSSYEAAILAARDTRQRWYFPDGGMTEEAIVILGDTDLTLGSQSAGR